MSKFVADYSHADTSSVVTEPILGGQEYLVECPSLLEDSPAAITASANETVACASTVVDEPLLGVRLDSASAIWVSGHSGGFTEFDHFPYRYPVRFRGKLFALGDDGLYMEADTREPVRIEYPRTDFGSALKKRFGYVALGYRSEVPLVVEVEFDDTSTTIEAPTHSRGTVTRVFRLPKGVASSTVAITIISTTPGAVEVDFVEVGVYQTGRRV